MQARSSSRRAFLGGAALTVGSLSSGTWLQSAVARGPDTPNLVLIVIDTLRADHVFGSLARTPNMDALGRAGIRFTRCFPEAMPTVPARRSIFSGKRIFPYRGWR